ncbi:hypothetical protein GA0115240_13471, partial [Streptomyces sp. DvalAA-14]|uniref:hypothetical protein n=1 Tax=unclassified Streptomyces TaxID=2593676 RepID=UPI00081B9619
LGDCSNPPTLFNTQVLPTAGTYTIKVSPPGIATGSFTFRVYAVPTDLKTTGSVGGPPVTLTTTAVGQKSSFTFNVTADQRVFFSCATDLADADGGLGTYLLLDPAGDQVSFGLCDTPPLLFDSQVLSTPGTYTITVDPPGIATGSVTVQAYAVPDDVTAAATIDGPAVGLATPAVGQKASVTFTGTAGQNISAVATGSTYAGGVSVQLISPDGDWLWGDTVYGADAVTDTAELPSTGTYTILISPAGIDTGGISYQLSTAAAEVGA